MRPGRGQDLLTRQPELSGPVSHGHGLGRREGAPRAPFRIAGGVDLPRAVVSGDCGDVIVVAALPRLVRGGRFWPKALRPGPSASPRGAPGTATRSQSPRSPPWLAGKSPLRPPSPPQKAIGECPRHTAPQRSPLGSFGFAASRAAIPGSRSARSLSIRAPPAVTLRPLST